MLLGIGRRNISVILLLETLLIGIFSLAVGLIVGIFGSQLMSILVAKLFETNAVLGYAYYLAITGVTSPIADKFMTAIGLGVVGTFMFFYSLSGFALKLVQASKKIYLKDLNMFVLRQTNWTIFRNNILNIKCCNIST